MGLSARATNPAPADPSLRAEPPGMPWSSLPAAPPRSRRSAGWLSRWSGRAARRPAPRLSLIARDHGRWRRGLDERRKVLVGATFVGPGTGELLHSATVAIVGEVPLGRLWHAVPSFPTISEVWLRLLETYGL